MFDLYLDWREQQNAVCLNQIYTKDEIFDLQNAKLECLREPGCEKVLGVDGNEFHHTRYKLCAINSALDLKTLQPKNSKSSGPYSILPALYEKPGKL